MSGTGHRSQSLPCGVGLHGPRARRLAFLFCAGLVLTACTGTEVPTVAAAGETLEGEWVGDEPAIAAFRGIPFAAPPIGPLRWRAPEPHVPRLGVQTATDFAPACVQGSYMIDWYADVAAAFGQSRDVVGTPAGESEDCLYLNVWTPELEPAAPLPVMVFLHGGANRGGWSYEPNYIGDRLAARGVVVVTITHRLGPLGFFAHPAIDNGPGEPAANFGLLDVQAALRWVRDNVGAFGGDSGNVTAFGESAGAGNLLDLALASPDDEALFRRLIVQSIGGALVGRRNLKQERALGLRLASALALGGEVTAETLRNVPAVKLLEAADEALPEHYFDAVIDGVTLVRQPIDGLVGERARRLEILAGTNQDEWLMYLEGNTSGKDVETWIREAAPEFAGSLRDALGDEPDPRRALDRLKTARDMLCPTRYVAERASAAGGQGFVYWFTRQRDGGERLGVYHGAELPYVFGQHDSWLPTTDGDRALTQSIMGFWVSFARDGQPRWDGAPAWPVYTGARPWVMELGEEVRVTEPHDARLCRYLGPGR